MHNVTKRFGGTKSLLAIGLLCSILSGCGSLQRGRTSSKPRPVHSAQIKQLIKGVRSGNEVQTLVKRGLTQLCINGNPQKASECFKAGLRLNPADGNLHFLNAISLHMMSLSGNVRTLNMAESGYLTALRFDNANHIAAFLLGHLYFGQNQFDKAQEQFSYALMYDPRNLRALNALSAAAYYNQDLPLAHWAAEKACEIDPGSKESIRSLLFSKAALGAKGQGEALLQRYQAAFSDPEKKGRNRTNRFGEPVSKRMKDWKTYHHIADIFDKEATTDDLVGDDSTGGDAASGDDTDDNSPASDNGDQTVGGGKGNNGAGPAAVKTPDMALIDVVIIRLEEARSQAKGINLLDGLRATMGGTMGFNISDQLNKTLDRTTTNGTSATSTFNKTHTKSSSSFVTPTFQFAGLEYNLNIFNNRSNRAEVLARPSLLAMEGESSKFFSGSELQVQLSSNNADGSMVDKQIGIHLEVTPKFYGSDKIKVKVHASKAFLEPFSEQIGFSSFTQTAKTSVDTTAVLKFGETLILSGLSENENEKTRSGVPILENIPGVQYLFSRDERSQTQKSILILLTPRKARYMSDQVTVDQADSILRDRKNRSKYSSELKRKERIPSNLDAVLYSLAKRNDFYRQFRRGDLEVRSWNSEDTMLGAVKRTIGFLYY